jgi:hypothetical protein
MNDNYLRTPTERGLEPATTESWLSRHIPYVLLLAYLYYCTQITKVIFDDFFHFYRVLPLVESAIIALLAAAGIGVVIRILAHAVRRVSWTTILRRILGEPTWWRTWYPRFLRDSASVWDRLPPALKLMRTVIWLELLLLPAGFMLAIFVIPTFQAVYVSLGVNEPLAERIFMTVVEIGGYILPIIALAAVLQAWRWRTELGLPLWVTVNAFISVSRAFWHDTDARQLLRH